MSGSLMAIKKHDYPLPIWERSVAYVEMENDKMHDQNEYRDTTAMIKRCFETETRTPYTRLVQSGVQRVFRCPTKMKRGSVDHTYRQLVLAIGQASRVLENETVNQFRTQNLTRTEVDELQKKQVYQRLPVGPVAAADHDIYRHLPLLVGSSEYDLLDEGDFRDLSGASSTDVPDDDEIKKSKKL